MEPTEKAEGQRAAKPEPRGEAAGRTMRAVQHLRYGEPDVLTIGDEPVPPPGPGEVLVRVRAAGVSIGDHHLVAGLPYIVRVTPYGGLPRPRHRVPGVCLAGLVVARGPGVTGLQEGDAVMGEAEHGAFADYAVVKETRLAPKPANLTFAHAAAVPWAIAPLQALRDAGGLKAGDKLLVYGASGGVGTWAVQIGKALGAHVTAVCSTRNLELVRSLGADETIDYTRQDFVHGGARFDVLLDAVGNRTLSDCWSVLLPTGTFVSCAGGTSSTRWLGRILWMLLASPFKSQKLRPFVAAPNAPDLLALRDLVESEKVRPVIERCYPFVQIADALKHAGTGHTRGQVVVEMQTEATP